MGYFKYISGLMQPAEFSVAIPRHKIVSPLLGVVTSYLTMELRDVWKIDFEVDKYISIKEETQLNSSYQYLIAGCEIYLEGVGWFRVDDPPEETEDIDGRVYLSFTAYGYETVLQDVDLINFYVNAGIDISIEMYEENLNALGIPMRNVKLYIPSSSDDPSSEDYYMLGLLNVIEKEYLAPKGWQIGHVDLSLQSKSGRKFEISNSNVFAFLTQDVCIAYECLVIFDRLNMTVNLYDIENIGENIPLEAAKDNLLNEIRITSKEDSIWTCFRVAGQNEKTVITYYNFGSDLIYNFDYLMDSPLVKPELKSKWEEYVSYRDSQREAYAQTHLKSLQIQEKIDDLNNRTPVKEIATQWSLLSLDELKADQTSYQNVLQLLINQYTVDGVLQIEGSADYALYLSIKDVILPDIQAWIDYRSKGGTEPEATDYQTNWDLYGIIELQTKKQVYENNVQALTEQGYNVPWDQADQDRKGVTEEGHNRQYALYQQYKKYIEEITDKLEELNSKLEAYNQEMSEVVSQRSTISQAVDIKNEKFGFTSDELNTINSITRISDYTDPYIEVQDTDNLETIISTSKELYESAHNRLEIESRPQATYSADFNNLFQIPEFNSIVDYVEVGNFLFLELDGNAKTKQRIVRISLELTDLSDPSLSIDFSDMVFRYGRKDDWETLLEENGSSSKNSIKNDVQQYVNDSIGSISSSILSQILVGSGGSGNLIFNNLSPSDLQKLADMLSGLVDGNLTLDQLEVELAKIDHLDANSAFVKYLQSQFLVANQGDFQELTAKVAIINDLLAGNVSAEVGQLIHLTAENVQIDEAVIKDLIAAQILVSDLKAGDITLTDTMRILSENGLMVMNGETLQIMGTDEAGEQYVAIQLGYDTENKPSLIIRDSTGSIMLDASGLHESGVPDGLIKDNMIAGNTISKDKLNFEIIEPNEFGGIDITQIYDGKGGQWGVQYNQFRESTETALSQLNSSIKSIELSGEQVFKEDNGEVSPATITISAITKGNITVGKWYLDDMENTSFVSSTGTSITIPYTYMQNKTTLAVKVEDTTGQYYDVMSIYKVSNGANGEDGITVVISSSEGYVFTPDTEIAATQFTATVYKGLSIIEPISYEWKAITDDGSEWVTIGTSKQVIITMNSFVVRKRVKCIVNVEDPVSEPTEGDTIGALTDAEITEIITLVFGSDAVPLKDTTGSDILDTTEAQILTSIDPETIAI